MEINGIAHVQLTVADFARAREFYGKLLPFLGLVPVMDFDGLITASAAGRGACLRQRPSSTGCTLPA